MNFETILETLVENDTAAQQKKSSVQQRSCRAMQGIQFFPS